MNHTGVRSTGSRRQALTRSGSTAVYSSLGLELLGEHPVPAGPLAVRWLDVGVPTVHAGTLVHVRVELENAGAAAWRGLNVSYHWLDERGNPIVWDGIRTAVAAKPGERRELEPAVRAPIPPGRYRLAFDLVDEHRFWLAELGNFTPSFDLVVRPRDASEARAFLPKEVEPAADWQERVHAAHAEGFAAVGGSIDHGRGRGRRAPAELAPYAPGGGRNPAFAHPLVCPSLLPPLEPNAEVHGLPAWRPEGDEPWLYDGRIAVRLGRRSRRPRA
jgi:hypothetical protein